MGTHIVTRMLPVQDAKSFQRAKLLEICEVEEQIMSNEKYAWLFSRQLEAIIFIIFQRAGKMFTNSFHFAAWMFIFQFSPVWRPLFCSNGLMIYHLELNLKQHFRYGRRNVRKSENNIWGLSRG